MQTRIAKKLKITTIILMLQIKFISRKRLEDLSADEFLSYGLDSDISLDDGDDNDSSHEDYAPDEKIEDKRVM